MGNNAGKNDVGDLKEGLNDLEQRLERKENDVRDLKEGLKGLEQRLERKGKEVTAQIDNTVVRVSCNIKPPPEQVKAIHSQIIKMIKTTFSQHGYELVEDGRGPILVTVV